jgi:hypothetical protein
MNVDMCACSTYMLEYACAYSRACMHAYIQIKRPIIRSKETYLTDKETFSRSLTCLLTLMHSHQAIAQLSANKSVDPPGPILSHIPRYIHVCLCVCVCVCCLCLRVCVCVWPACLCLCLCLGSSPIMIFYAVLSDLFLNLFLFLCLCDPSAPVYYRTRRPRRRHPSHESRSPPLHNTHTPRLTKHTRAPSIQKKNVYSNTKGFVL